MSRFLFNSKTNIFHCNKKISELLKFGKIDDARKMFDSMTQRDSVTWNSMISGYSKNNRIKDAQALFDICQDKNVTTWTAMLSGYAKIGRISEAVGLFKAMPERNIVSYNAMISGYLENGDFINSRKLFDVMVERNVSSWNSMITGYCRCGRVREARALFDVMPERNSVSWLVMISGYVEMREYEEAWDLFLEMNRRREVKPDQAIFVVTFSAAMGLDNLELVMSLLTLSMKIGSDKDVVVGTAILNALTRIGSFDFAIKFFEGMQEKNDYSYTTMITAFSQCARLEEAILFYGQVPEKSVDIKTAMMSAFAQNGRLEEARILFDELRNPNVVTWNALLSGYAQHGMVEEAKNLFARMPVRNLASWGTMISGLLQNGQSREALEVLAELHRSGIFPGHSIFASALLACSNCGDYKVGRQLHSLVVTSGYIDNTYIGNGLISMYAKFKNIEASALVFSSLRVRDIVSWNAFINGLSENNMFNCAFRTFQKMPKHDIVSWNSMFSAYVQAGEGELAFRLFLDMLGQGIKPSELTIISLLSVCASLRAAKLGKQIHALIYKVGLVSHLFVGNALVNMYFKCCPEDGIFAFEGMEERDLVTWNTVLTGCGENGFAEEAIQLFQKMKGEGVIPDQISFLGLLCACSHAGLLAEGLAFFSSMIQYYLIPPTIYHYTAVVDLLGRAGHLSEAESIINKMPFEPDAVILKVLLGACRIHNNISLGQKVSDKLCQIGM